jgi:hypothetical protein
MHPGEPEDNRRAGHLLPICDWDGAPDTHQDQAASIPQ